MQPVADSPVSGQGPARPEKRDEEHDRAGLRCPRSNNEDNPMLYCPVCSTRLASLKCKLICEKCGYYMSCADYY
jgi:hypothetical protein